MCRKTPVPLGFWTLARIGAYPSCMWKNMLRSGFVAPLFLLCTAQAGFAQSLAPDWSARFFTFVSDPNVAFILLMIGLYGIILEIAHPGTFIGGVLGTVCLIVGLVALSALPVHLGAALLLLVGIGLMIAELFTPGVGIVGAGGLAAFVAGAMFLFEGRPSDAGVALAWPVIAGTAATTALVIFGIAGAAMRAHRQPPLAGAEELIGSHADVIDWTGLTGTVRLHGEIWFARSQQTLEKDAKVRVVERDGLTLTVEPA
jgi:membrane-bound serine protease (ClpP class)